MAGTIPLSLTQQNDKFGVPLIGGKLYLIQAGTVSTPQNGYQDSALTIPWPNPIILDAYGRLPQFWLADGSIKIRLTDVNGVEQFAQDGIIVTGASSGGGGGSPVDATTILATGDIKARYGTGALSGFVRANGRTLGSATSGATERANLDCDALFEYLWNTDANLVVSTGRGVSSAADWAANKTIALPDWRGKAIAGLDDMGNSAAGIFSGATFTSGAATTLGSIIGAARRTLTLSQIPTGITSPVTVIPVYGNFPTGISASPLQFTPTGSGTFIPQWGGVGSPNIEHQMTGTATSNNTSGAAHDTVSPYLLTTIYLKL